MRCAVVLSFLATTVWRCASGTSYESTYCTDLKPQHSVDVSQVMGMWYGVEVIPHMKDDVISSFDTCPVIHIAEISYEPSRGAYTRDDYFPMTTASTYIPPGGFGFHWTKDQGSYNYRNSDFRHLRLIWEESGRSVTYYLKFNNTRKGFWMSSGPESNTRGSLLKGNYNHFAGTMQVIKAVGDHLVLTICQRLPESELYSVILSREPLQLSRQVIHSIHNLLNRRDLSTSEVRKVCNDGNITAKISLSTMIIMLFILFSKS